MPSQRCSMKFCNAFQDGEMYLVRKENSPYCGTLAVSIIFHLAVFIVLVHLIDGSGRRITAEKIITVDITIPEYLEPKPVAPVVPINPSVPRTPSKAKTRPQAPVERTSPVPIAPLAAPSKSLIPDQALMTVPQKVVPRAEPLMVDHAAPATAAKETAAAHQTTVRAHSRVSSADVKNRYQVLLKQLIEKYKEYPPMARKAGREGTCSVRCVIGRDGAIKDVSLIGSSGHEILDRSALRAVRSVGRFTSVPQEIEGGEIAFEVPISYSLGGN
jgi:periplasmic protein TonB